MARSKEADVARLYHLQSSNVRSRPLEPPFDGDLQPLRFRTYVGSARTALPGRDFALDAPLGAALERRRSVREFALRPMPLTTLGRLLHASYGVRGLRQVDGQWICDRAAPSAGGLYPLEIYVAAQAVEGVPDGLYHYDARAHELELRREGAAHAEIADLALGQEMVLNTNVVVIITAIPFRTMWKYGQRGYRYVWIEAGHLGQNLYLVATAMGLGPVAIGGFYDEEVKELLSLPAEEDAVYLLCIGQPGPAEERTGR
ncbi:dehydrogenase SagB [Sorangium cellulosum]|uniref:Dehydrogenase SagB n=1 Tax=Sorangium cellulosum TaxID=56 RepID=A0A2L0F2N2_SORCE|nr:SagB/ThcOx family dehydrogenase [Sorangium cellulosum]AUX45822.1 dehydrogenase SagB [Sorangium cellulosum]